MALARAFESIALTDATRLDQWLDSATDLVLLDMNFAPGERSGREGLNAWRALRVHATRAVAWC